MEKVYIGSYGEKADFRFGFRISEEAHKQTHYDLFATLYLQFKGITNWYDIAGGRWQTTIVKHIIDPTKNI